LDGIAGKKMTNSLSTGQREHGIGKIQPHDLDSRQFALDHEREIAAAGRKIKDAGRIPAGHDFSCPSAPGEIAPKA
jgi:hypothetical protein